MKGDSIVQALVGAFRDVVRHHRAVGLVEEPDPVIVERDIGRNFKLPGWLNRRAVVRLQFPRLDAAVDQPFVEGQREPDRHVGRRVLAFVQPV